MASERTQDEHVRVVDRAVELVRKALDAALPELLDPNSITVAEDAQNAIELLLQSISAVHEKLEQARVLVQESAGELKSMLEEGPALLAVGERLSGRIRATIPGIKTRPPHEPPAKAATVAHAGRMAVAGLAVPPRLPPEEAMTEEQARKIRDALVRSFFREWVRLAQRREKEPEPPEIPVSERPENQRDRP